MRILHTPFCQVCNGRANKVTSVILTWDYSNVLCPMFPRCCRPCCVWCRIMFWACFVNTGIYLYTLRGRTLAWPGVPLSSSLCVACKSFSYTGQAQSGGHWGASYCAIACLVRTATSHWTLTSDNIQSVGQGPHRHHHQVTSRQHGQEGRR